MNRGLEIRAKKRKRNQTKRLTVKENQKGVCRFIDFKNQKTERINGKSCYVGAEILSGLQVENKFYYIKNGEEHFCFMNKKGTAVKTVYSENEISGFAPQLLARYHEYKSKINQ